MNYNTDPRAAADEDPMEYNSSTFHRPRNQFNEHRPKSMYTCSHPSCTDLQFSKYHQLQTHQWRYHRSERMKEVRQGPTSENTENSAGQSFSNAMLCGSTDGVQYLTNHEDLSPISSPELDCESSSGFEDMVWNVLDSTGITEEEAAKRGETSVVEDAEKPSTNDDQMIACKQIKLEVSDSNHEEETRSDAQVPDNPSVGGRPASGSLIENLETKSEKNDISSETSQTTTDIEQKDPDNSTDERLIVKSDPDTVDQSQKQEKSSSDGSIYEQLSPVSQNTSSDLLHSTDTAAAASINDVRNDDANNQEATGSPFAFSDRPTIKELNDRLQHFIRERNWDQFHAPRNVLLALVGEVGELSEIFQWKGEVEEGLPGWSDESKKHLGQELSDVLLYLLDLAYRCRVDLPQAALDKLALNAQKYPQDKVYGSSKKYTEYQ